MDAMNPGPLTWSVCPRCCRRVPDLAGQPGRRGLHYRFDGLKLLCSDRIPRPKTRTPGSEPAPEGVA